MEVFKAFILPVLIFVAIGAVSGLLLVIGSKVFEVKSDETAARIFEALPNANCGACGFSGCEGYAAAIAGGKAPANLCKPGGAAAAAKIAAIMGTEVQAIQKETAYVRCNGCEGAVEERFVFVGTPSCAAVERFYNGSSLCRSGCDGYGDCVKVCGFGAISIENGIAVVDSEKCTACGKCAAVCPNKLIVIRPESQKVDVRCSNCDAGKIAKDICKNSCIGCKICEKKCPESAITVQNNLASIDYSKCTGCGICAQSCPRKCIVILHE